MTKFGLVMNEPVHNKKIVGVLRAKPNFSIQFCKQCLESFWLLNCPDQFAKE